MHLAETEEVRVLPMMNLNNTKPKIICLRMQNLSNRQLMSQIKEYTIYYEIQVYE